MQNKLVEKGYAKTAYLYGDYKYTSILKKTEEIAKAEQLGIWYNK
ncbi:MAG: thermonuclease family protein [Bacilli bacterium]|nr:thermonuclease family protein [Bacilli bacterium]